MYEVNDIDLDCAQVSTGEFVIVDRNDGDRQWTPWYDCAEDAWNCACGKLCKILNSMRRTIAVEVIERELHDMADDER